MQNLIERISQRTGMDHEQSLQALLAVSEHVKEEFPLLHSVVDLVLGTKNFTDGNQCAVANLAKTQMIFN